MGRPRLAKHPKPEAAEAEDISQESPEEATGPSFELNRKNPPSKADMVRRAMAEGIDNPTDGVAYLKSRFGIDLPKPMWSSYIAQQKARDRKAAGGESTPRTRPAPVQAGIPAGFSGDIRELRALMDKAGGGDELKQLIGQMSGLLGKYGPGGFSELMRRD